MGGDFTVGNGVVGESGAETIDRRRIPTGRVLVGRELRTAGQVMSDRSGCTRGERTIAAEISRAERDNVRVGLIHSAVGRQSASYGRYADRTRVAIERVRARVGDHVVDCDRVGRPRRVGNSIQPDAVLALRFRRMASDGRVANSGPGMGWRFGAGDVKS